MKSARTIQAMAAAALLGWLAGTSAVRADTDMTETWTIAEGGKLYDHWSKVLFREMKDAPTHPSYPKSGKQKGETTWRCKECHGWDYKGKDGAYAKGSHFTGIKGLRDAVGMAPEKIAAILRDKTHGFTAEMIPNRAAAALAVFVSRGQHDVELVIDRATRKAGGDAKRGARFYQSICAICHGFDGKQLNFKSPEDPEFIGTVANENPWETLHKIRNGQPGIPMPSLGVLELQDQVDILTYAQTLPKR
jgi:thiosulfate dehydrogenase